VRKQCTPVSTLLRQSRRNIKVRSSGNGGVQTVPPTQLDNEDDEMKEKETASPKVPPRKVLQRLVPAGMTPFLTLLKEIACSSPSLRQSAQKSPNPTWL
jgi:hypothetical protein